TVVMLRKAFAGARVEAPDRTTFRLGLLPERPPAIWVAALGPKAVRVAGEVADGVILNWCTPERVEEAAARVAEAAEAADRDPSAVTVAVYVRGCVLDDEDAALAAAAVCTGEYASYPAYARQFAAMGFGREAELAATAHAARRPQDVPAALVRAVCLVGEAPAARERLEAFRAAGAHVPVVYPVLASGDRPAAEALATLSALAPPRGR
ncbi:MAG: LLM class flavin-dependent oxidoreductase, partial [Actinomycetota bacterium]